MKISKVNPAAKTQTKKTSDTTPKVTISTNKRDNKDIIDASAKMSVTFFSTNWVAQAPEEQKLSHHESSGSSVKITTQVKAIRTSKLQEMTKPL